MDFENVTLFHLAKELDFNVRDIVFVNSKGQKRYEGTEIDQYYDSGKKCPWNALLRPRFDTLKIRVR